jgi:hypothetical protein
MFWWRRRKTTADLDDIYGSLLDLVAVMEDIRADLRAIRNNQERQSSQ